MNLIMLFLIAGMLLACAVKGAAVLAGICALGIKATIILVVAAIVVGVF